MVTMKPWRKQKHDHRGLPYFVYVCRQGHEHINHRIMARCNRRSGLGVATTEEAGGVSAASLGVGTDPALPTPERREAS